MEGFRLQMADGLVQFLCSHAYLRIVPADNMDGLEYGKSDKRISRISVLNNHVLFDDLLSGAEKKQRGTCWVHRLDGYSYSNNTLSAGRDSTLPRLGSRSTESNHLSPDNLLYESNLLASSFTKITIP